MAIIFFFIVDVYQKYEKQSIYQNILSFIMDVYQKCTYHTKLTNTKSLQQIDCAQMYGVGGFQ